MKIYKKVIILLLLIVSFSTGRSEAQESLLSSFNLSEEEAVTKVIHNNYDLRLAKVSVALAKAELIKAGLWSNPEAEFSIRTDKYGANEGEGGWEYGINQALPVNGRIAFQKKVAQFGLARADWQLEDMKRLVTAQARKMYSQIATLEEKEKILSILVKINHDSFRQAQARLAQAEVSSIDVNLAQSEFLLRTQELAQLKSHLYEARSNLNQLMGEDLSASFIVSPKPLIFPLIDLKTAQRHALENRPDLKAKAVEEKMGTGALNLAKAMRIPDITVGGFLQQDKSVVDVNSQLIASNNHFLGFKISIPLPFFNHNQDEIASKFAQQEALRIQYEALLAEVSTQTAQAYIRLTTAKEILSSYENGLRQGLKGSIKLMQNAYSQGQVNIFDVVQAENKLYNIEQSYLEARQNAREAIIDFEFVMGMSVKEGT